MKQILLICIWLMMAVASFSQSFVFGIVNFNRYDFRKNEIFHIVYQNKYYPINIDSMNNDAIVNFLGSIGVSRDSIIGANAYGSSDTDVIEILYAYKGTIPKEYIEIQISISGGGLYTFGDASQNKILINSIAKIPSADVYKLTWDISTAYPVRSFMVKPLSMPSLAFNVLSRGVQNGVLADMRNINNSYRLVDYFKELNWQIIHYKDALGVYKTVRRPVKGW